MSGMHKWVALAWRLPAGSSTPRVTTWRNLRRIGAARLTPGAALLPTAKTSRNSSTGSPRKIESLGEEACVLPVTGLSESEERVVRRRMVADRDVIHAADMPQDEPPISLAPGVLAIFDGIRDGCDTDEQRLARGFVVCDALYQYYTPERQVVDE